MELFVPGRICLFGEHSDWAGEYRRENSSIEKGYTLICGTNQGIYAEVQPFAGSLRLSSITPAGEKIGPKEIPFNPADLLNEAAQGGFWSYIAGTAYQVLKRYPVKGLSIHNFSTDLPVQKGMSSSAAISVLTARAFGKVYGLNLSIRDEMELAYLGETTTPSKCGRMDQGCAFGPSPVLMTFDGDNLQVEKLHPQTELYLVIVDLMVGKNTQKILARLNECFHPPFDERSKNVMTLFGAINKDIVHRAVHALENGNAREIGALMSEAQAYFDRFAAPVCPEELTAPVLHRVLEFPRIQPHVWGGKGVGSQGDGSAQFIARSQADQAAIIQIVEKTLGLRGFSLTITPLGAAKYRSRSAFPASKQ